MEKQIRTERPHLFTPNIGVALKVEIEGNPTNDQLKNAIDTAVTMNEVLNCKIVLEQDGSAYYEKIEKPIYSFITGNEEWTTLVKRNIENPYKIFDGEMCRFYILRHDDVLELLIIGHHLAGDGFSFFCLLEDIMKALDGKQLQYKPLEVVDINEFPKNSNMPWIKKLYLSHLNNKWITVKEVFNRSHYEKVMQAYSENYSTEIFQKTLCSQEVEKVLAFSKKIGVTVNSILTTAFIKAYKEKAYLGMSVSIRDKRIGMGNFASGTAISYHYNSKLDFAENAKKVHKMIYDNINNVQKKYFVLRFVDMMDGSFLDSACMVKYLGYGNKVSKTLATLMGYGNNPRDIGVSNLTRSVIPSNYGKYAIKNMAFVPPIVPYCTRVFGIVTHNDTMCITYNTEMNGNRNEKALFETALQTIIQ